MSAVDFIEQNLHPDGSPACSIVNETAYDERAREALLDRAMGTTRRRKSSEKLRRGRLPSEGLAFVARDANGSVRGTVRLWDIQAGHDAAGKPVRALLLGPLAVDPALKGQGIGAALMQHATAEAGRLGHGAVILVGDPEYYERFGFSGKKTTGLAMPGPVERRRFLALELKPGHLDGAHGLLTPKGRRASHAMRVLPVSLRFSR
ncbi:GNAT family N-acetyltransferase [Phyllobacterium endophyticum]|uniref:GNAT family N-acetyltransferase n=1 Tax=Phyllobacterium endophyticum TaxID=1149773 RepID=A0A2P7AKY6_9HYPH|nr:N-acetyltransferase [Phyllobacterium endophyticum]MBB3233242.1 putative N-acetyltransferase YhbS [Phyllobacterium endophyticum]PSH54869.1 GNAT family N-acetyltransferase [Phyllobacterium endophyticum]TYR43262.1 N-acetyltransferase [Phyllobacterium endophyticum]